MSRVPICDALMSQLNITDRMMRKQRVKRDRKNGKGGKKVAQNKTDRKNGKGGKKVAQNKTDPNPPSGQYLTRSIDTTDSGQE